MRKKIWLWRRNAKILKINAIERKTREQREKHVLLKGTWIIKRYGKIKIKNPGHIKSDKGRSCLVCST